MTQETGPLYCIPLIEFLPMGDTMRQAMPSRDDLEDCILKDCDRVAAGYEVLLAHYHQVCEERDSRCRVISEDVAHVLRDLDALAKVWGDEAVFRRCRDKLRHIVEKVNP